jgi:choline dehydrogenase-like flavoprotein
MTSYDVIIIGTGAGGGTLARHLAPSGKRILLLERGDWLPREPSNWLAQDLRRWRHEALRCGSVPASATGLRRAAPSGRHLAGLADHV